jgi:hypothetical protein
MTFPLDDGGDGVVICAHDFAMPKAFAVGQLARLRLDTLMVLERGVSLAGQTLPLGGIDLGGVVQLSLGVGRPHGKGLAQRQHMACGLTYDGDEHAALASALAAKTTHGFLETAHEDVALDVEHPSLGWPWEGRRDVVDSLEDFFWAL